MRRILACLAAIGLAALGACATGPGAGARLIAPYTAELARSTEPYAFPYTALHARGERRLAFVAATHTIDPASTTMRAIWNAYSDLQPAAVIIEGFPTELGENPRPIVELIEDAGAPDADPYSRGEAAYAARLAMDTKVPFMGGEPTEAEQTRALRAQGFSARDIFFTDLLKVLPQSIRGGEISGPEDSRFEDVFARWTVSLSIERDDPPRFRFEDFERWYLQQYGVDYRIDARFADRADPAADTLVGRILRAQSLIRDRHLYRTILDQLDKRGRVLVVYGGTHRTALAGALNAALGPAELRLGLTQAATPVSGTAAAATTAAGH